MNQKIRPTHLQRRACVYLRQSSPGQVENNRESTERQYALVDRAKILGWDPSQIETLDGDLGKSGTTTAGRDDFQRLMASVGLGQVGAVLALEASRLSRSQADWHKLLDVCALTDTLIIDHDGLYDPNDFNDRVLLGFKGTWSHTELHGMRLRLQGAKRNKALKGELRHLPPAGYVYNSEGCMVFDPDASVIDAVRLVFRKFHEIGSAFGVARYFNDSAQDFPGARWSTTLTPRVTWAPITHERVLSILKNPTYAGVYTFGKSRIQGLVRDGEVAKVRQQISDRAQWLVFIKNAHPAYVTWEEFMENEVQISRNRHDIDIAGRRGMSRKGACLLQGLVICGRCGSRMTVNYHGEAKASPSYVCDRRKRLTANEPTCWGVAAPTVDAAVEKQVLKALTTENVDLSLLVLNELRKDEEDEEAHWRIRLEKARYETDRARRQYDLVEPENRLVARGLEEQWNQKLGELARLEQEYVKASQQKPAVSISELQRRDVMKLAHDLPSVWHAKTTATTERKELLSLLVKQVALTPIDLPERRTKIDILWHTGAVTTISTTRPRHNPTNRHPDAVIAAIRALAPNHEDKKIAAELNKMGLLGNRKRPFTGATIGNIRYRYGIKKPGADPAVAARGSFGNGRFVSTSALARRLGVSIPVIAYWRRQGIIAGFQNGNQGPWWYEVPDETLARLQARAASKTARKGRSPIYMEVPVQ